MNVSHDKPLLERRALLAASLAALGLALPSWLIAAEGEGKARAAAAMAKLLAGRAPAGEGLKLTTPAIAENGNTVPISVEVASPFTANDYVKAIHVFAEDNPAPEVVSFYFTQKSGRAAVATRIRLARSQRVVALAELSDGRVLEAANQVKVTIGGCGG